MSDPNLEVQHHHGGYILEGTLIWKCEYTRGNRTIEKLKFNLDHCSSLWSLCERANSSQCKIVIKVVIINILLYAIWISRNNARFNNSKPSLNSILSWISASVSLSGSSSAFMAELCGFMITVDIAVSRGWSNLYMDRDRSKVGCDGI
ncbi:unnamed protein product [Trifolium pratense]|uniref:Uncharacterized protein n=1 Tax=Trifolium pratense TaxID=57577 RepID=A0ACB0LF56_TRIPR|nr:unnamed protein product [Trifolium pratense]